MHANYKMISANIIEENDNIINKIIQRDKDYNIEFNFNKINYYLLKVKYLEIIFDKNTIGSSLDKIQVPN